MSPSSSHPPATRPAPGWPLGLAVLLVASAATLLSLFGVADSDFFWHLKTGEQILEQGQVPVGDAYSHTARGAFYAYYSWLAEVMAALLARAGGIELVVIAKALGFGLLFVLMAVSGRARGGSGPAVAWALLYALLLARFRFYARPELFTLLLLVLVDLLAVLYLRRGFRLALWLLPPVTFVWSNLHPYVIVGLGVLVAHAVGEAFARRVGWPQAGGAGSPWRLLWVSVAACGATLLNPYGARIYTPALKLVGDDAIASLPTREWLPPTYEAFGPFFVLGALATLVVVIAWRRMTLTDLGLWAVLGGLSLLSLRNIGVFAVLSGVMLAAPLGGVARRIGGELAPRAPRLAAFGRARLLGPRAFPQLWPFAGLTVVVTLTLLSPNASWLHQDQSRHYRFGTGLARYSAPVAAVEFIESRGLSGPVYNSWAFGGYLIWRSWPRLHVSLDGRQMLYGEFLTGLLERGPGAMIRETDTRLGLVQTTDAGSVEAFRSDPRFQLVFFDDLSLVFVRDDALPPGVEPYRLLAPEDLTLGFLAGADDARLQEALAEAVRATDLDPDGSRAWMLRGALARRAGDLAQSLDALDRAIELDPTQMSYHNQRGVTLLDLERVKEARLAFERAVALDPRSYAARYNLGLAWIRLDEPGRALRAFRRALRLAPAAAEVRLMLGALEDRPARARAYLQEAIALSDDPALVARAAALLGELD